MSKASATTSEAAVNALLAKKLPDGSPVAIEIDTHYFDVTRSGCAT
jgi:hypothetical protein